MKTIVMLLVALALSLAVLPKFYSSEQGPKTFDIDRRIIRW